MEYYDTCQHLLVTTGGDVLKFFTCSVVLLIYLSSPLKTQADWWYKILLPKLFWMFPRCFTGVWEIMFINHKILRNIQRSKETCLSCKNIFIGIIIDFTTLTQNQLVWLLLKQINKINDLNKRKSQLLPVNQYFYF